MPFFPISRPSITELERDYLMRAVTSGWISSIGEFVERFESQFAAFCGTKHALAVANGTVALQLALKGLGIGSGDEIIVPDLSFIATANAVLHAGATPVFADVDPETLCLDPHVLEKCLTSRTRAIMPVHLYGHPAEMSALTAFAEKHALHVVEDAAEAHGAEVNGKKVGSLGRCGCFSFYGNKILTTGEGGMLTTNDPGLYERCRFLRDQAMSTEKRYWHPEVGYNFRLTNIQAAIGCAQIERVVALLARRREVFEWYSRELADEPGILLNRRAAWAVPSYWMICVEFLGFDEARRAALMSELREQGVDSRPYFYPMSQMPYFRPADTPVTHSVYARGINVPTYFDLTPDDVGTICRAIRKAHAAIG